MTTLRFETPVRLLAASAGKPRRLSIVGYTGGVMRIEGFGPLVVDLTGLELPRSIPVLADHDSTLAGVVGPGIPTTDGRQLFVSATLADTPAASTVISFLEAGVGLQASLGADPLERRPVEKGETVQVNGQSLTGPFSLITRAKLKEMTVLPLGADDKTSVLLAAKAARGSAMKFKSMLRAAKAAGDETATKYSDDEIDKMSEGDAKAALKKCMADATADDAADKTEPPASARALVSIMSGTSPAMQARAANEEWSERRCSAEALTFLRAGRAGADAGRFAGGGLHRGSTDDVIHCALLMKGGGDAVAVKAYGANTVQAVRDSGMHRMPFKDIFATHLQAHGVNVEANRDLEYMIRASGVSTASLPNLLSNTLNKVLELQWQQAPGSWRSWCAVRAANDFKPAKSLRPVFVGKLAPLGPGGSIDNGNLLDFVINWSISQFAKMFTLSRVTLINDDLNALSGLPSRRRANLPSTWVPTCVIPARSSSSSSNSPTCQPNGSSAEKSSESGPRSPYGFHPTRGAGRNSE